MFSGTVEINWINWKQFLSHLPSLPHKIYSVTINPYKAEIFLDVMGQRPLQFV